MGNPCKNLCFHFYHVWSGIIIIISLRKLLAGHICQLWVSGGEKVKKAAVNSSWAMRSKEIWIVKQLMRLMWKMED